MIESITNWSLHAYVDGELDGKERADVEKRLKDDAEARDFVEAIRRQKQALHDAYDDVLRESVPVSLVNVASQTESWRVGRWAAMAACVALLAYASLQLLLRHSIAGKQIMAIIHHREVAISLGINAARVGWQFWQW